MIQRAKNNLANEKSLIKILGKRGVKWAKRISYISQMPGMLEEVYADGLGHLPGSSDPAPIMAFAHKKFFDVQSIVYFMAGRDIKTFHGITIMSQAGLHSAIYPYSELIPNYLKNPVTDPLAKIAANAIAYVLKDMFSSLGTYPVYREGIDVPDSKEAYNANSFGGTKILGMTYDEYKIFAAKQTRQTLMQIFRDMDKDNKSFIIAPEGGYCHNGAVQVLEEFIGFCAHRKKRNTIAAGISYDELCPDDLGRISCYISASKPLAPPKNKNDISLYLKKLRQLLLDNQTIVASQIIAIVIKEFEHSNKSFSKKDLLENFEEKIHELKKMPKVKLAPILLNSKERELKVFRFLKNTGKKWLTRNKNLYTINKNNINKFNALERSVNSLDWNYNQVQHLL